MRIGADSVGGLRLCMGWKDNLKKIRNKNWEMGGKSLSKTGYVQGKH